MVTEAAFAGGTVSITEGARAFLDTAEWEELVARHLAADWGGAAGPDLRVSNEQTLAKGEGVVESAYPIRGREVNVATDLHIEATVVCMRDERSLSARESC